MIVGGMYECAESDNVEEVTEVQSSDVVNMEDRKLPPDRIKWRRCLQTFLNDC